MLTPGALETIHDEALTRRIHKVAAKPGRFSRVDGVDVSNLGFDVGRCVSAPPWKQVRSS